jgi:hypothetical protein
MNATTTIRALTKNLRMKTIGLFLLSIFTAKVVRGDVGGNSHDGKSRISAFANDKPLPHLRPQRRRRQQQQTLNYRATYTADFQHLIDPSCTADSAALIITCDGKKMEVLNVSHPSIECGERNVSSIDGTVNVCTNKCTEDGSCSSIYEANVGVQNAFEAPYGSIRFMCEGNVIQDVNARFIYFSVNNETSCISDSNATERLNLRAARLGVSCPTSAGVERNFVFDDTYFECRSPNVSAADTALAPNDEYACFNGQECKGGQACSFEFNPIQVLSQVPNFANECIQALVPIDGFPTPAPQAETSLYRVRFEASWISINPNTENCASNSDSSPKILATCDNNGESTIVFVNATDINMKCSNIEQNTLECTGDPNQSLNSFTNVTYVSFVIDVRVQFQFTF